MCRSSRPAHPAVLPNQALRSGTTLTRDEWFALIKLPRLSSWTVTKGELYLFNYATLDMAAKNEGPSPSYAPRRPVEDEGRGGGAEEGR